MLEKLKICIKIFRGVLSFLLIIMMLPVADNVYAAETNFRDVPKSAWYYSNVQFVFEHNLMSGTSETTFEPNTSLTRAMLVTILYRLGGTDNQTGKTVFSDVKPGTWYSNAVSWAADQLIITGYGNGLFGPNDSITREQLAAIMYRYAVSKDYSDKQSADLTPFKDASLIHSWARESIEWAVAVKMISGKGNGILDPQGKASRAEIAAIMQRFYEQFVEKYDDTEQLNQKKSAPEEYMKETSQMILDNPTDTDSTEASANAFFSRRLIVKTNGKKIKFENYKIKKYVAGPDNTYFIQFASESEAEKAEASLAHQDGIVYVEPDQYIGSIENSQDSSSVTNQSWGAEAIGSNQYAEHIAAITTKNITVAVVDTGVSKHTFLKGRFSDVGYDLVNNDYDPKDANSHGTHVAGILVDCTPGLNNVEIMPVRVLDADGNGMESNVGNGIRYAADHGAKVINLSLCSPIAGKQLQYLEDCIRYAVSRGVCVVQAAGNSNENTADYSPADMSETIVVGAVDRNNKRAYFSNHGDSLDLVAPGVEIFSCVPGGVYEYKDGTSMAAPHASAAAAMLMLEDPSLTPAEVEKTLKDNSTDLGESGWDVFYGSGLLNLNKLLVKETISDSWEKIIASIQNGTYKSNYQIGDTKSLNLGPEGIIKMEIVAFDADELADGSGKAAITWIAQQSLEPRRMNPELQSVTDEFGNSDCMEGTGSIGGWENSELRSWLKEYVKPLIPSTVRDAIKPVTKYSLIRVNRQNFYPDELNNAASTDDIWIPSAREIFGWRERKETMGPYYSNFSSQNSIWWLRSAGSSFKGTGFCYVSYSRIEDEADSESLKPVIIGFCL